MTAAAETAIASRSAAHPGGPRRLGRSLKARVGLVVVSGLVAAAVAAREGSRAKGDRRDALAADLREDGYRLEPKDVVFLDGARNAVSAAVRPARALVAASRGEEPSDLYLVETRLSPAGVLLSVEEVHNLTGTTGAEEVGAVVIGDRAFYVAKSLVPGAPTTIGVLDLAGETLPREFSRSERAQTAVTAWQETGRFAGIGKRTVVVDGEGAVSIAALGGKLEVIRGADKAVVDLDAKTLVLPAWLHLDDAEVARPGNVTTWAVDRVRASPWFGDDGMQALKQVAFTALDFVLRNKEQMTGDTGAEGIAEDLGQEGELGAPKQKMLANPDLGWPPPPLEPWVTPALPGEGEWNAKDDDGFFRSQPNLPPVFLTTFVRSDRSRKATRVYVALWDPRRVELDMMAGSVEPKSATGKAGPGTIPRTPEMMKRVVGATNAGFQALHGEYGMMSDGVVYLPPKPYAATVAATRDGSTVFGSWPESPAIPDEIKSYRQNMSVMVEDEKFNPFGRTWWGGTVPGAEDKTHTVRTGMCLTKESFVAYFYGADLSPDALAQAMIQARCSYGLALDMNAGHSGMEFYKVAPTAELGSLERPLQKDWEAEGEVPGMDGWSYRSRRLIRGMGLMNFPRYIKREARDFFFLALRHNLPGENIAVVAKDPFEGEGAWTTKGLPQHGFPYAVATSIVRPDADLPDFKVRVLAVDPHAVAGPGSKSLAKDAGVVLAIEAAASGDRSLVLSAGAFAVTDKGEAPPAGSLVLARGGADGEPLVAAFGVGDESGFAYYVEPVAGPAAPKADDADAGAAPAPALGPKESKAIVELLGRLGCSQHVSLAIRPALALGGDTALEGGAVHPPRGSRVATLQRAHAPGGGRIFRDTPIVSKDVWYPLQQKRVRYFKKHDD
jgi:hypothetical protein